MLKILMSIPEEWLSIVANNINKIKEMVLKYLFNFQIFFFTRLQLDDNN